MIGNSTYPSVVESRTQATTDVLGFNGTDAKEEGVYFESGSLGGLVDMTRTKSTSDQSLNRTYQPSFSQRAPPSITTNFLGLSTAGLCPSQSPPEIVSAPLPGASMDSFIPNVKELTMSTDLISRDVNIWSMGTTERTFAAERIPDSMGALDDFHAMDDKSGLVPPQFNGEFLFDDDSSFEAARGRKYLSQLNEGDPRSSSFLPRRSTFTAGSLAPQAIGESMTGNGWPNLHSHTLPSSSSSASLLDSSTANASVSLPYNIRRSQGPLGHLIRPSDRTSHPLSLSNEGTANSSSFSSPDLASQMSTLRIGSSTMSSSFGSLPLNEATNPRVKPHHQLPYCTSSSQDFTSSPAFASASSGALNFNPTVHRSQSVNSSHSGVCRYYLQGYCSRGDKCHFSHSSDVNTPRTTQSGTPVNQAAALSYAANLGMINGMTPAAMAVMAAELYQQHATMMSMLYGNGSNKPVSANPFVGNFTNSGFGNGLQNPSSSSSNFKGFPSTTNGVPPQPRKKSIDEINRFSNMEMEDLVERIYPVAKDQHGCRFLQRKIEEGNEQYIDMIYVEVISHFAELMTDPFGNYLCQKLFEHCQDEQKTKILEQIESDLVHVSLNLHGTRAVQKLIEYMTTPEQIQSIIRALSGHVVLLIKDLNGNHVIQKCLYRLSPEHNQFIYDSVADSCVEVATHRHGCCVLQRCIDHASDTQKRQLVDQITCNSLALVQDPFGNYVVQYVLDLGNPEFSSSLINTFVGHICNLSVQKFSSNVMEKCIRVAEPSVRALLIEELLDKEKLEKLLRDSFANYVIQTSLDFAAADQRERLIQCIRPILPAIRHTPYGKRIQSKLMPRQGPGASMSSDMNHMGAHRVYHSQGLMMNDFREGYKQPRFSHGRTSGNQMYPYGDDMNGFLSERQFEENQLNDFRLQDANDQSWMRYPSSGSQFEPPTDPLRAVKASLHSESGDNTFFSLDMDPSLGFSYPNSYL